MSRNGKRFMKILVLSYEAWNDITNGNNVTSNWFEGMDAEFANIYASPGEPYNQCCQKYYQITDSMMLKSIISGKKAGKEAFQQERRQEKTAESPRRAETGTSPPAPEKERAEKDEYTP